MDQSFAWQSCTGPNLGHEGDRGPNLHIGIQYGPMNHFMSGDQAHSEYQYSWDPLMASAVTSQGSNLPLIAANVWQNRQLPSDPRNIFPGVPNRSMSHNLVLQPPMIQQDMSIGHPIAQGYPTNGHAWLQGDLQRQRAFPSPDDFGQGNMGSFGDPLGDFGTPSIDYGAQQFLISTPSPGSTAHGSPETPGSLYEDKMGYYLDQDEPWKPWSVDHGNYEATQDKRDRSCYYSYGQSISLDHW